MSASLLFRSLGVALLLCPLAVHADNTLQTQIDQLKLDYDARLQSLQQQLDAGTGAKAPTAASAFNPSIALILAGHYAHLRNDPEDWRIQGFIPTGGEVGPGERGFSLGESELTLSASVDRLFSGALTFALAPEGEVEVEEAFVQTLGLAHGFNAQFGRFFSALGYLNSQHAHRWDFIDAPLVYQAFFDGQFANEGVQLRWLAPGERFFEIGAEAGRESGYPASGGNRNGVGVSTLFARLGDDLGPSSSWQGQAWYQYSRAQGREYEDVDSMDAQVVNAFSGHSDSWGLAAVYKWKAQGAGKQAFTAQAEFMQRREKGELAYDTQDQSLGAATGGYRSTQSGWYAQAVYQFIERWRAGLRYEQLDRGSVHIGLVDNGMLLAEDFHSLSIWTPKRTALMLDYSPSEFSRLRLQLAHDQAGPGRADTQVLLQYVMSLGAHSAHSY